MRVLLMLMVLSGCAVQLDGEDEGAHDLTPGDDKADGFSASTTTLQPGQGARYVVRCSELFSCDVEFTFSGVPARGPAQGQQLRLGTVSIDASYDSSADRAGTIPYPGYLQLETQSEDADEGFEILLRNTHTEAVEFTASADWY